MDSLPSAAPVVAPSAAVGTAAAAATGFGQNDMVGQFQMAAPTMLIAMIHDFASRLGKKIAFFLIRQFHCNFVSYCKFVPSRLATWRFNASKWSPDVPWRQRHKKKEEEPINVSSWLP